MIAENFNINFLIKTVERICHVRDRILSSEKVLNYFALRYGPAFRSSKSS